MENRNLDLSIWLPTGEQYCPDCHHLLTHRVVDEYWECDTCKWSITDEEAEDGDGYPTLESTYEVDYRNGFETNMDMEPEVCKECGGAWPECESGCRLFRD